MQKFLFLLLYSSCSFSISAQSRKSFSVGPGKKLSRKFQLLKSINTLNLKWEKSSLRNGTAANVKLNYNSVFGEMQYIDPKNGDTLSLA